MNEHELKKEYRAEAAAMLENTDEEYRSSASAAIAVNLLALPEMKKARNVMLYVSVGKEPATLALISKLLEAGKKVCLPRCIDSESSGEQASDGQAFGERILEARRVKGLDDLTAGSYGIPEPPADDERCPLIPPRKIDLIVLPCVACDAHCNRLGHGAGYYDRFLQTLSDKCTTIALCYDKLLMNEIPMEEHDMKVDAVITEKAVHRWRPQN